MTDVAVGYGRAAMSDDLRGTVLEAASALLAEEGPEALTVRRIAARAGCSTMGLYTSFGGKNGVVDALYNDGFTMLRERLETIEATADPLADLRLGCAAYRAMALEHPTYYRVMFDRAVPDHEPPPESLVNCLRTLGILESHVQHAIDKGRFRGDAVEIAHAVWATCHGLVSLELHGLGRPPKAFAERFTYAIDALLAGLASLAS
jgi:AcrR family transcriptional regulator